MPDITTISAVLANLKAATEIAKFLRQSDISLEKAELKLKVADLISTLADLKNDINDINDLLSQKERKIVELKEAFELKGKLTRSGDAYYNIDEKGQPIGPPYCLRCWESEQKRRQLVNDHKESHLNLCTNCGQRYHERYTEIIRSLSLEV